MTTLKIQAEIDPRGNLRLDVPVGLPPGKAEVVIVVQTEVGNGQGKSAQAGGRTRSGLFVGKSSGNIDIDVELAEMNQAWKSKLSGLQ